MQLMLREHSWFQYGKLVSTFSNSYVAILHDLLLPTEKDGLLINAAKSKDTVAMVIVVITSTGIQQLGRL